MGNTSTHSAAWGARVATTSCLALRPHGGRRQAAEPIRGTCMDSHKASWRVEINAQCAAASRAAITLAVQ
jgi:hypothetical protein